MLLLLYLFCRQAAQSASQAFLEDSHVLGGDKPAILLTEYHILATSRVL